MTIFTVMSRLAQEHGALNLSQGFPDFSGPAELMEAVTRHMAAGHNQYAPMAGALPLREAIAGIGVYDWLVFTSPNGVDAFFREFFARYKDVRGIGAVKIATIGAVTAQKVRLGLVAPEMAVLPKYHCTVEGLPLADALRVTSVFAVITWLAGDVAMTGGSITVSTATALVALPYELVKTAV